MCDGTTEAELMARVVLRDAEAFEELYARFAKSVRRQLACAVRDAAAVDDLVQEVFLRVWTHAGQWDGRGLFRSWLQRIAANYALNHLRSVRRRREQPLDMPDEIAGGECIAAEWIVSRACGPHEALAQRERKLSLARALSALPDDKRAVMQMICDAGMDVREVAETLGIPEGTVRSRLHYARKRIAREWDEAL